MFETFLPGVVVKVAQGRGAQVANAQAVASQVVMRAGFGEAALVNVSKGKAYLIVLGGFCQVASEG